MPGLYVHFIISCLLPSALPSTRDDACEMMKPAGSQSRDKSPRARPPVVVSEGSNGNLPGHNTANDRNEPHTPLRSQCVTRNTMRTMRTMRGEPTVRERFPTLCAPPVPLSPSTFQSLSTTSLISSHITHLSFPLSLFKIARPSPSLPLSPSRLPPLRPLHSPSSSN